MAFSISNCALAKRKELPMADKQNLTSTSGAPVVDNSERDNCRQKRTDASAGYHVDFSGFKDTKEKS